MADAKGRLVAITGIGVGLLPGKLAKKPKVNGPGECHP